MQVENGQVKLFKINGSLFTQITQSSPEPLSIDHIRSKSDTSPLRDPRFREEGGSAVRSKNIM
jgi:hypothetical protein